MRLVAGVLALALFAPVAHADDPLRDVRARAPEAAARGKVTLRVVRIMPESRQALLFDRTRATHVLAEVGGQVDGYTVEDIDEDAVTLGRDGQQVVLTAPPRGRRSGRNAAPARLPATRISGSEPAPVDPYGDAPVDPYGDAPVRVVEAPGAEHGSSAPVAADTGEPGIRVAHAPNAPAPGPIAPGEGGIRVAEAPGAASPSTGNATSAAPRTAAADGNVAAAPAATAPPATVTAAGTIAAAPAATAPPPIVTAAGTIAAAPAATAPPATVTAAGTIAAAPAATAPPATVTAAGTIAAAPAATAAPRTGATDSAESHGRPAEPVNRTAGAKPSEVRAADAARAPDKATLDARALADVMTADRAPRAPRAPHTVSSEAAAPTRTVDVRPAASAPTPEAAAGAVTVSRSELDGALADFAGLSAGIHGSFSAAGLVIDGVGDGTIFQRAGLRAGDVVTAVDGVRLRSLDDAANLYARASTARAVTAQIVRGGKPIALHVVIQ